MAIGQNDPAPAGWKKVSITGSLMGPFIYKEEATGRTTTLDGLNSHLDTQAQRASSNLNPDGSAKMPTRESLLDPATGLLKEAYKFKGETLDPTKLEGYQAIKGDALRTGPSSWLTLAQQKQQAEQSQANDQANQSVLAGNAQARSGLAMRGGLSSGARERLGSQMQKDMVGARQKVAGEGILARASLNLQDEQMKRDSLKDFASAEGKLSMYNTDIGNKGQEFNILQSLMEKGRGDDFNMKGYEEQMKKWAADRQAEATERSGGGGGGTWICTEIINRYGISIEDARALNKLKAFGFETDPEATNFYVYGCEPLVKRMKEAKFDWREALSFMQTVVSKVHHDDMDDALEFYRSYVLGLMDKYWPDCADRNLVEKKNVRTVQMSNHESIEERV